MMNRSYGLWGDQSGLYLRSYSLAALYGTYATDEEVIDLSGDDLANPSIIVAPKNMLMYSPRHKDSRIEIISHAMPLGDNRFRILAKTRAHGHTIAPLPTGITSGDPHVGEWQGTSGIETDFFRCRVHCDAFDYDYSSYAMIYQYVTNEFTSEGHPTNWVFKRSETVYDYDATSGVTVNMDIELYYGVWAIKVDWHYSGEAFTECSVVDAGYRTETTTYLDIHDQDIDKGTPSGMTVLCQVFDQG